jgi:serine/threonine-protein kinase
VSLETYGRYQLLKKLATGGMAQIYLARQVGPEGFEKLLVVKRILPHLAENEDFITMFLDEARIAARLNHPNIVQIFDLGAQDDSYFIAMEYIHGEDVRRVWKHADKVGRPLPLALICRIIIEACAGLDYAHKKTDAAGRPLGIVHRDISPQNILVSFEGGVKVVDFGIAKAADQATVTRSGVLKGKYSYMSPEQAGGQHIDCRTDIFALGVVLYELLTGTRLFKRATDIQTLNAVTECNIAPPSEINTRVPKDLDDIVMRALAKERDARFPEARQLGQALESWMLGNQLPSSNAMLAEFMHEIYAERLAKEQEEGRLLVETAEASRGEDPGSHPEKATPTHDSVKKPTRSMRSLPQASPARPPRRDVEATAAERPSRSGSVSKRAVDLALEQAPSRPVPQVDAARGITEASMPTQSQGGRRGPLLALLAAVALAVGGAIAWVQLSGAAATTGGLALATTPPGAEARAGAASCRTPCTLAELPAGPTAVRFALEGHQPLERTFEVPAGQTATPAPVTLEPVGTTVPTELVPEPARPVALTVETIPAGALVLVNGERVGTAPATTEAPRGAVLDLRAELSGYEPAVERYTVGDGEAETKTLTMKALPRVNGTKPPLVKPPPVDPVVKPPPVAAGRGTVRFVVKPWATVECGPFKFGDTPFADQPMPAGEYRCTFSNPDLGQKTQLVRVEPNVTTKVSVTFSP